RPVPINSLAATNIGHHVLPLFCGSWLRHKSCDPCGTFLLCTTNAQCRSWASFARGSPTFRRPPDSPVGEDAMIRTTTVVLAVCLTLAASGGVAWADFIYGGDAYGAFAPGVPGADPPVADTGPLPATGGMLSAQLPNFNFMNVVTSGALDAQTMGSGGV